MAEEPKLGQILVQSGAIDESQLGAALEEHRRSGHRLGLTLVRLGFLAEPELVRALASQLQLPIVSLGGKRVDPEVLAFVPRSIAEKHNVLPLFVKDLGTRRELYLGMEDPCDSGAVEDVACDVGIAVRPVIVAASELAVAIDRLYREGSGGDTVGYEDGDDLEDITETLEPPPEPPPGLVDPSNADTRAIVQALSQLLVEAGVLDRDTLVARISQLDARIGRRRG